MHILSFIRLFFETESLHIVQGVPDCKIPLPQLPEVWNSRYAPSCPAQFLLYSLDHLYIT